MVDFFGQRGSGEYDEDIRDMAASAKGEWYKGAQDARDMKGINFKMLAQVR